MSGWQPALDWAGIDNVQDPAAVPLVLLVFVATSSITGLLSRRGSRAHTSGRPTSMRSEITQDYDAFIETEHGLSTRNLIDLAPSWWRYVRASHPPPAERLQLADLWRNSPRELEGVETRSMTQVATRAPSSETPQPRRL